MGSPMYVTIKIEGLKELIQEFAKKLADTVYGNSEYVKHLKQEYPKVLNDTTIELYGKGLPWSIFKELEVISRHLGLTFHLDYSPAEWLDAAPEGLMTIVNGVITRQEEYRVDWENGGVFNPPVVGGLNFPKQAAHNYVTEHLDELTQKGDTSRTLIVSKEGVVVDETPQEKEKAK